MQAKAIPTEIICLSLITIKVTFYCPIILNVCYQRNSDREFCNILLLDGSFNHDVRESIETKDWNG